MGSAGWRGWVPIVTTLTCLVVTQPCPVSYRVAERFLKGAAWMRFGAKGDVIALLHKEPRRPAPTRSRLPSLPAARRSAAQTAHGALSQLMMKPFPTWFLTACLLFVTSGQRRK